MHAQSASTSMLDNLQHYFQGPPARQIESAERPRCANDDSSKKMPASANRFDINPLTLYQKQSGDP
jgi:hypothetical protein